MTLPLTVSGVVDAVAKVGRTDPVFIDYCATDSL